METDDPKTSNLAVRSAPGIAIQQSYSTSTESDSAAKCINIGESCISADGLSWNVTFDYKTIISPLSLPAVYEWSFAQSSRIIDFDTMGTPIVNSTGLPFQDPDETPIALPVMTIKKNQATYDNALAAAYVNAVNSDTFLTFPPDTVRVIDIAASSLEDDFIGTYYAVSYSLELNLATYKLKKVDAGLYELDNGNLKPILTQGGTEISEPALLDGSGAKLPSGGTPAIGEWHIRNRLPFSGVFNL